MPYSIEILPTATKEIGRLPKDVRTRIVRKIDALAQDPRPEGVRQLHAEDRLYRIRVADYRVVYQVRDERLLVIVVRVRHRKDVYRGI